MMDIGDAADVEVHENNISIAHKVPSFHKDHTPSFGSSTGRRKKTARDVNALFPQQRLYINKHFSPEIRYFFEV
ncbi:hypothetical protein J6590_081283 [Homalodisca vitripennis]|nr:hypothetical protein J6590_081283 [Homalodisca vitripennis]